ncbi:MAG: hypothetical protein JST40_00460 [Armatimonadetes bacterium]|nr:hypothetical protein [Armatimonadota bacterium]
MKTLSVPLLMLAFSCVFAQDYAENNASSWEGYSTVDGGATTLTNDTTHVRVGSYSVRFDTLSGFETGVRYPKTGSLGLNATTYNYFQFDVYPVNDTPYGFQDSQPKLTIYTPTGNVILTPGTQMLSNKAWNRFRIPLAGDSTWTRTTTGNPNLANVTRFQLAFDTWDYAFTLYLDGAKFINYDPTEEPPAGPPAPFGVDPNAIKQKVLLFVFDPILENYGNKRVHKYYNWGDPVTLTKDTLGDLRRSSHYRYLPEIVETQIVDAWPYHLDGYQYNDQQYVIDTMTGNWHNSGFDYARFLDQYGITPKIVSGDVDEVWVYAFPGAGMWESTMAGNGGYWCNSGPVQGVPSDKLFVVMGWNYERGVAEAIHSFGHRAESVMVKMYGSWPQDDSNNWGKFALLNKNIAGKGGVGNVHFPVNATSDYDYYNSSVVTSNAVDWYNYPNFKGTTTQVTRSTWSPHGTDPHREYLNWWYHHMPHMPKRGTDYYLNNWWRYLVDVDQFKTNGNLYFTTGIPSVSVTAPTAGQVVSGTFRFKADGDSDGALGRVDFYIDGNMVGTDSIAPYQLDFDTTALRDGMAHTLVTKAYDLWNQTEAVSPERNFTTSNSGTQVAGIVAFDGYASDIRTAPLTMEIWQGSTLKQTRRVPFNAGGTYGIRTSLPNGSYTVRFKSPRFLTISTPMSLLGTSVALPTLTLKPGDIDGDNTVTIFDYVLLSTYFDRTSDDPNWNTPVDDSLWFMAMCDLDGDNAITIFDYLLMSENFDTEGN